MSACVSFEISCTSFFFFWIVLDYVIFLCFDFSAELSCGNKKIILDDCLSELLS